MGAAMAFIDCGGGLAVDYDGSFTDSTASMAYTLQHYANDGGRVLGGVAGAGKSAEPLHRSLVDAASGHRSGADVRRSCPLPAPAVVSAVQEVCIQRGIPPPTIMTESGRALASHHSVLVFDVLTT